MKDICKDAVEFLRISSDAESTNRAQAAMDLRFVSLGEQWDAQVMNSRELEGRPQLTINTLDTYIKQIGNNQRQQRPRGVAHAVNTDADEKVAKVITGVCRHFEVKSDADQAYATAFDHALRIGWGYFRMRTDYTAPTSFDQDIVWDQIENPLNVYFDPMSTLPDGSDQRKCLITDMMRKSEFKAKYPKATDSFTSGGYGDSNIKWESEEEIRVAEYFWLDDIEDELVMLSNGQSAYRSQLPKELPEGIAEVNKRKSFRRIVRWAKITQTEVLEQAILPGRYIPVVPVYGTRIVVDGKRHCYGMVKFARDPARQFNFWRTAAVEWAALQAKTRWLAEEGTVEGYESDYAYANTNNKALLKYRGTTLDGQQAQAPERLDPPQPNQAAMQLAMTAGQDLQSVLGMHDPQMGSPSDVEQSGVAVKAIQGAGDTINYHFYDNLGRAIKHGWRIALSMLPEVVDTQRTLRILGDDGKPSMVTVNQPTQQVDPNTQAVTMVLKNPMGVGDYDVVLDTGPGFESRRQQMQEEFNDLMAGPLGETVAKVGADLVVRLYPDMDQLADRLEASNPMAQIDENSEIPPKVQMMIKQGQQQIQQLTQENQMLKLKQQPAMAKAMNDAGRLHFDIASTLDDHELRRHDIDTREATAYGLQAIKSHVELALANKGMDQATRELVAGAISDAAQMDHEAGQNQQDRDLQTTLAAQQPQGAVQ